MGLKGLGPGEFRILGLPRAAGGGGGMGRMDLRWFEKELGLTKDACTDPGLSEVCKTRCQKQRNSSLWTCIGNSRTYCFSHDGIFEELP